MKTSAPDEVRSDRRPSGSLGSRLRQAIRAVPTDVKVASLFAVLGVVFTWPVARYFFTHLPADWGAQPLAAWMMSWQTHTILRAPLSLFDGPMFYPFENSLLLSETMSGGALLALPVWLLTQRPAAVFNLVVLASFPIASFGAYLLLRDITRSTVAGVAAGIVFGFSMYRLTAIVMVHVILIMWIPYVVFFLHRFMHDRRWLYAAGAVVTAWLQVISSGHGALMLAIGVLLFSPFLAVTHRNALGDKQLWLRGGVAAVGLVVMLLPFVVPYVALFREHPEFRRDAAEVTYYSASSGSFLIAPRRSWIYQSQPLRPIARAGCGDDATCARRASRESLFPGLAVLVVAAGSVLVLRRRKGEERVWLASFALVTFVAGALSIGTDEALRGPYGFAYRIFPALDTIRVPGRITVLTMLGVAGLVGLAVASVVGSGRFRSENMSKLAGIGICVLLLIDVIPKAAQAVPAPPIAPLYDTLAQSESRSPILELPTVEYRIDELGERRTDGTFIREVPYLYAQTRHWRPLVNGRSSNIPPNYIATVEKIRTFPDEESVRHLRELGVGCVIVHRDRTPGTAWAEVEDKLGAERQAVVLDDGVRFVLDVSRLTLAGPARGQRAGCL